MTRAPTSSWPALPVGRRTGDVQAAAHQEIGGYWRRIARQRKCWLQDTWVDSGLIVLPRTEAVLTTGDLITKTEAISRLADFGFRRLSHRRSAVAEMVR